MLPEHTLVSLPYGRIQHNASRLTATARGHSGRHLLGIHVALLKFKGQPRVNPLPILSLTAAIERLHASFCHENGGHFGAQPQ